MNFLITIDKKLPYFQINLSGQFDLHDLEKCYVTIFDHPDWAPGLHILWNAKGCTFEHLDTDDLHAISDMTSQYKQQRGEGRAAWVVSRDIDFGISRMFEMLSKRDVIFDFCVFKTIPEAQDFLSSTDENI